MVEAPSGFGKRWSGKHRVWWGWVWVRGRGLCSVTWMCPLLSSLVKQGRGWASWDAHTETPCGPFQKKAPFPFLRKGQGSMLWGPDLAQIGCFETMWNHKIGTNRKKLPFHPVHYALAKNMALVFRRKIKNRFGKNWGFLMFPLLAWHIISEEWLCIFFFFFITQFPELPELLLNLADTMDSSSQRRLKLEVRNFSGDWITVLNPLTLNIL